jgi:hypothetical protein
VGAIALASATGSGTPRSDHAAAAASTNAQASVNSQRSAHAPKSVHAPRPDEPGSTDDPSANPSPSLVGLCNAWLHRPHQHGKADSSAAFRVLVTAAGGSESVTGYCRELLGASPHPAGGSTERHVPTLPSQAGKHPNGSHPSGKPAEPGAASSHATRRP